MKAVNGIDCDVYQPIFDGVNVVGIVCQSAFLFLFLFLFLSLPLPPPPSLSNRVSISI